MHKRSSLLSIFGFSIAFTLAALFAVGYGLGFEALVTMVILTLLEVTFSLDNAVVNAATLQRMSVFWQRMFMTVGTLIAVFGMRLFFPLLLVSITAGLSIVDAGMLALQHPHEYSHKLTEAEPMIAGFGGMFLLMIFLAFVLDPSRKTWWQKILKKIKRQRSIVVFVALVATLIISFTTSPDDRFAVTVACLLGVVLHLIMSALADVFNGKRTKHAATSHMSWKAGLIMFLYLELIDASFSFDSVIGAFAVTTNTILIAAGLGVGAIWVRSITIYAVRHGVLAHYPYLDAGAHYAIGALALLLIVGSHIELPDVLTGATGLAIIVASFIASVLKNRRDGRVVKSVA